MEARISKGRRFTTTEDQAATAEPPTKRRSRKKADPHVELDVTPPPPPEPVTQPDPEAAKAVDAFKRQRLQEQTSGHDVELEPLPPKQVSHLDRAKNRNTLFDPIPDGFISEAGFHSAGLRVLKSVANPVTGRNPGIAALQFANDRTPNRDEKDSMEIAGIKYNATPGRRLWERRDEENPGVNTVEMIRQGEDLAERRVGRER